MVAGAFASLPTAVSGCLYAVEFDNGWVKVGMTVSPRRRMRQHQNNYRAKFDAGVSRFFFGPALTAGRAVVVAERKLLADMHAFGRQRVESGWELFEGVPFATASELVAHHSRQSIQRCLKAALPSTNISCARHGTDALSFASR